MTESRERNWQTVCAGSAIEWTACTLTGRWRFFGRINLYYLTGTIQDGMLVVPRDGQEEFWVRRSYRRACMESRFPVIHPMVSFRDARKGMLHVPPSVHIETGVVPLGLWETFRKHFPVQKAGSLDAEVAWVRARKSPYEVALLRRAGEIHRTVLEEDVPALLKEGMSEAAFATAVYARMVSLGHQDSSVSGVSTPRSRWARWPSEKTHSTPRLSTAPGVAAGWARRHPCWETLAGN